MFYSNFQIVFQEVPDEISLCFSISGCTLGCKGCHSTETWNHLYGKKLTEEFFAEILNKYDGFASAVLFLGGEWESKHLIKLLNHAKQKKYKTALYTGLEHNELINKHPEVINYLDFLKTGRWVNYLGGLDSPTTNQRFYSVKENKLIDLTHKFKK